MNFVSGMVSVLTPAYNRINYIDQTVQSVVDQSYTNIEYIVIDDGSSDGTYERLEQLQEQGKLKLLSHPGRVNKGQAAALNVGLAEARGEFVCVLDSDDWFATDKLKDQVEYLQKNPGIGLVYGQSAVVDADGVEQYRMPEHAPASSQTADDLLLDCFVVSPGCALMRHNLVHSAGGFDVSLRSGQDHDLALKVVEKSGVGYTDSVCFYYRKHDDTISQNGLERRWTNGFKILNAATHRYPYKAKTVRKRLAVLNFRMAQVRRDQKKAVSTLIHLIKSSLLDPARVLRVLLGQEKVR